MRRSFLISVAGIGAFAFLTPIEISPVLAGPHNLHRGSVYTSFGPARVDRPADRSHHNGSHHLAALVGDRESGLGFYALPNQYRTAAHPAERRGDAIRYAIASEAGYGYYYGIGGDEGFGGRNHHALFNPVDGYRSPFFAGYYGSARDDDSEPGPIGGTPYKN